MSKEPEDTLQKEYLPKTKIPAQDLLVEINKDQEQIFFTATELMSRPQQKMPYLWERFIPKGSIVVMGGTSATGKSSLIRQLSIAICCGKNELLGQRLEPEYKSVLVVSTEENDYQLPELLRKSNKSFGASKIDSLVYLCYGDDFHGNIRKFLALHKVDLLVLDNFLDAYPDGSSNSATDARGNFSKVKQIIREHRCSCIVTTHLRKGAEKLAPDKSNLLGSQAYEAVARVVMEMRKDPDDISKSHLCVVKHNYAKPEETTLSYEHSFNSDSQTFSYNNQGKFLSDIVPAQREKGDRDQLILEKHQKGMTQAQIAKEEGLTQGQVSKILKRMKPN